MPLVQTHTFRVRHYECDAQGYLSAPSYLRYMQEAAFDASAAAGYGMAQYRASGYSWLIRESNVHYLQPVSYGDVVEVRTWVADFRRVRSRRAYEFRLAGNAAPVARAQTDWAFLESASGRPAAIPREMIAAFRPESGQEDAPPRVHLSLPATPAAAYSQQTCVGWCDLDPAGHVNNAVYLAWVEDAGVWALAQAGWPPARLAEEGRRAALQRSQIEYQLPALLGDELVLRTWVSDLGDEGGVRWCTIAREDDGAPVARARAEWRWQKVGSPPGT
jgi:acyl-CoA thioester hydrolase